MQGYDNSIQAGKGYQEAAYGLLLLGLVTGSPLLGIVLAGESPASYLQFPPQTSRIEQPGFSWIAFYTILLFVLITTWPFWRRLVTASYTIQPEKRRECHFPWWGWAGLAGVGLFWVLAWTRFPWFAPFQRYTFFPLWFCMIMVLNGVAFRFCCQSLLTHRSRYFVLLFPLSAAFWWVFEYLNRFVNNWYYTGTGEIGSWQYFAEATLAFSTVLPAVLSMRYILLRIPLFSRGYTDFPATPWLGSRLLWAVLGFLSLVGLAATGLRPELSYPFIWISPVLLWLSFQVLRGRMDVMLRQAARGDMTLIWTSAVAALLCGFFWEMWNIRSEARWVYNIPGVEIFHIFEMPLLGYAGYLPFGVVCGLAAHALFRSLYHRPFTWLGQPADP